jgi:hypothetical protein
VKFGVYQCCLDHVTAASAGHVRCLQSLQMQGRFLGLDSPERGSAGEVRKLQVWEAAHCACKAGHAGVLSWLFAPGWPAEINAYVPRHLPDLVKPEHWDAQKVSCMEDIKGTPPQERVFVPELLLCRYAMQNPDPACLVALLNSGCRSKWICDMAALEGREDFWDLAAEHGCPFDLRSWVLAAREGQLPILRCLLRLGLSSAGPARNRPEVLEMLQISAMAAAEAGHADCLEALLRWNTGFLDLESLSVAAMERGHIPCLQVLLGYVPTDV